MKVVLLKDVKAIGRAHDTVEAKDGFALNFLIPKKMAVAATEKSLKEAEMRQKQVADRRELDTKLVKQRLEALAEGQIVIRKKANEKGHLYDTVDAREVAIVAELPHEVIRMEKAIKELGVFEIPVTYGDHFGKFSIRVEAE